MTQPPFEIFVDRVTQRFRFLVDEFEFQITETAVAGPEAWVTFQNQSLEITVAFEIGSTPWVAIGKLERQGATTTSVDEIPLDLLAQERLVESPLESPAVQDSSDEAIDRTLTEAADTLRKAAGDILAGDTEPLTRLRKKAEANAAERESELFGNTRPNRE
jgi:hypothetical protein